MLVRERMSTPPVTVTPDTDYKKAIELMQKLGVRHLPVVDEEQHLMGMIAERDLLVAATRYMTASVDVNEVMQTPVVTVTSGTAMGEAAKLMASNRIGSLPVVEGGRVVGMLTETDVFRTFAGAARTA